MAKTFEYYFMTSHSIFLFFSLTRVHSLCLSSATLALVVTVFPLTPLFSPSRAYLSLCLPLRLFSVSLCFHFTFPVSLLVCREVCPSFRSSCISFTFSCLSCSVCHCFSFFSPSSPSRSCLSLSILVSLLTSRLCLSLPFLDYSYINVSLIDASCLSLSTEKYIVQADLPVFPGVFPSYSCLFLSISVPILDSHYLSCVFSPFLVSSCLSLSAEKYTVRADLPVFPSLYLSLALCLTLSSPSRLCLFLYLSYSLSLSVFASPSIKFNNEFVCYFIESL